MEDKIELGEELWGPSWSPTGNTVWNSARNSVWNSVGDVVWLEVVRKIWDGVDAPVRSPVRTSVWVSLINTTKFKFN